MDSAAMREARAVERGRAGESLLVPTMTIFIYLQGTLALLIDARS